MDWASRKVFRRLSNTLEAALKEALAKYGKLQSSILIREASLLERQVFYFRSLIDPCKYNLFLSRSWINHETVFEIPACVPVDIRVIMKQLIGKARFLTEALE